MSEYLSWYLVELRLRLSPHLPLDRTETLVAEVDSHLRESAKGYMRTPGISEDTAIVAAINAFGTPDSVASSYLEEAKQEMFGLPRHWVVLASGLVATACWTFHWSSLHGFFDNFGATWQNGIAAVVGVGALILFFLACRGGYRSYRGPLVAMGLAACVAMYFLLSFCVVGERPGQEGFSRFHLARDMETARGSLRRIGMIEEYVKRGQRAFAAAKTPDQIPLEFSNWDRIQRALLPADLTTYAYSDELANEDNKPVYSIPEPGLMAMVDGRIYGAGFKMDFMKAKDVWAQETPSFLQSAETQRKELIALLASAQQARSGQLFFFNPRVFGPPILLAACFMPALLLMDAFAFLSRRRRPAFPRVRIA